VVGVTEELRKELIDLCDSRYVRQKDCSERHEQTNEKINEMAINQAKNTTQLSFIIKIGLAILTTAIGILSTQIGSVIFK
jgi:hypothetical protein